MYDDIKGEEKIEDETSVREAEILKEIEMEDDPAPVSEENAAPKKRRHRLDFYIELALFLILGILVGISAKTEAKKYITIGFDDYKMKIERQAYNINQLQTTLDAQQAAAEAAQAAQQNAAGGGQVDQGQGQAQTPPDAAGATAGQGNQG